MRHLKNYCAPSTTIMTDVDSYIPTVLWRLLVLWMLQPWVLKLISLLSTSVFNGAAWNVLLLCNSHSNSSCLEPQLLWFWNLHFTSPLNLLPSLFVVNFKRYLAGNWMTHLSITVYPWLTSTNQINSGRALSPAGPLANQTPTKASRELSFQSFPLRKALSCHFSLVCSFYSNSSVLT